MQPFQSAAIMNPIFFAFVLTGLKLAAAITVAANAQPDALFPSPGTEIALSAKVEALCRASCDHLISHLPNDLSSGVHSLAPSIEERQVGNVAIVKVWYPCSSKYPKTKAYINKALSGNGDVSIKCSLPEGVQIGIFADRPDGIGAVLFNRDRTEGLGGFTVGTQSFYMNMKAQSVTNVEFKTSGYITKKFSGGSASTGGSKSATPRSVLANGANLAQAIVPISAVLFLVPHALF